jgi:glycosyltransferase involved in cell wall biosynthesis
MKFLVIIPIFNEEKHLDAFFCSLMQQSYKNLKVIVVNDNSTDNSSEKIAKYADLIGFETYLKQGKGYHESGAKVIETFQFGLQKVTFEDYDVIVKLDADLILPANYFEKLNQYFSEDHQLGICGGVCVINKNGKYEVEKVSNNDHVRGAFKAIRNKCFKDIGGLRSIEGWDTLDEMLAEIYGWKIKVDQELQVVHLKPTDIKTGIKKASIKAGNSFRILGYNATIAHLAAVKLALRLNYPLAYFYAIYGFYFPKTKSPLTKEEKQKINILRLNKIIRRNATH